MKYTPINLHREKGSPFCMVFLYHPEGVQLYTGDLYTIHKALRNGPTCHGSVVHPGRSPWVEMFGKNGSKFRIIHCSIKQKNIFGASFYYPHQTGHKYFLFQEVGQYEATTIFQCRRLPKKYLKLFGKYDG